jgi:putative spermidine/putrescine transport system permease protein
MLMTFRHFGLAPFTGIVVAHTVLGMPYVIITVSAGLREIDPDLELAAMSLGARPLSSFLRVTLPLVSPSIFIGAIFAFVASWDEVIIAQFLASPTVHTLPVTMWEEARESVDPTLAAASSLLTIVMLLLLGGVMLAQRARQPPRALRAEIA